MPAPVGKPVGWRSLSPNYGFVLAPRPNIFEAQLAFCQFVEFSPDLYIDCFIATANPDPDSAGVDFGCANGIALGTQDVQYFGVLHHWLLLLRLCAFSRSEEHTSELQSPMY